MDQERHKYEYQVNVEADTAPARVVRMVGKNKRVLEIGAGPGSITKPLQVMNNCRVTALEIDSEAIKKLSAYCEHVYSADLNNPAWPDMLKESAKFEVVIAADVLEHLYNPLATLKAMKSLLIEDGCIVVSLPHAGHSVIQACLFDEDFEYRDVGLLDRTHIRFFGIKNIQKLFEDADMKIIHAEFVVRNPENTEFAERWANTPQELRNVLAKNPFGLVYQVVVKAVSNKTEGEEIIMMNMLVPPQSVDFADQARAFLRARVSANAYSTLREIYVSVRKLLGKG